MYHFENIKILGNKILAENGHGDIMWSKVTLAENENNNCQPNFDFKNLKTKLC